MTNQRVMVTGAAGTWGTALIELLIERGTQQICAIVRGERQLLALRQKYKNEAVSVELCDIRDRVRLTTLARGCDTIFHLAALKHVNFCEEAPLEAMQTNVTGTQNVIDAALANKVRRVIFASTDKAVSPTCTYGCTKLLGEKLILSANQNDNGTQFMVLRSGNLLGSSGSVLAIFKEQAASGNQITLTHPKVSRFFLPIRQAAQAMLETAQRGAGGEVFIPQMPSIAIGDIARWVLSNNGRSADEIEVCGLRAGEKLWEEMTTKQECEQIYTVTEHLSVIAPQDRHGWISNGFVRFGACGGCGTGIGHSCFAQRNRLHSRACQ